MSRDNDFPLKIKNKLAQRAGYKCCYLGCGQATMGPSKEKGNTEKNNTGVAAHIHAASSGKNARRKPPKEMISEDIKNLKNGIWMCYTHGKYIDSDETIFNVKQLQKWKNIGEQIAKKMQEFRCNYLEALSELEHLDPRIHDMTSFAQKHDPSDKKYNTIDLFLYRKMLDMIPNPVRWSARQGIFPNSHPQSVRTLMLNYCNYLENNPVEFSFFDNKLQKSKEKLDSALLDLENYLSLNTFPDGDKYAMSQDWKRTTDGSNKYTRVANSIQNKSSKFINTFDDFHKICRKKFAE